MRLREACKNPLCLFAVFFVAIEVALQVMLPLGGGLDEGQHIARVDQICAGDVGRTLVGYSDQYQGTDLEDSPVAAEYGGFVDDDLYQLAMGTQEKLHTTNDRFSFPARADSDLAGIPYGRDGRSLQVFSNTVINNPVVYLPSVLGELIARPLAGTVGGTIVGMRIGGVVAFGLLVLLAIWLAPRSLRWLIMLVALAPNTLATISFVSADTLTIAMALLFFACWASLMADGSHTRWRLLRTVLTVVSGVLLGLLKLVYVPLTLLLALVPALFEGRRTRQDLALTVGVPVGALALGLLQSLSIAGVNTGAMFKGGVDPQAQGQWVLSHIPTFMVQCFSCMSSHSVLQSGRLDLFAAFMQRDNGYLAWMIALCLALVLMLVVQGLADDWKACVQSPARRRWVTVALVIEFVVVSGLVCAGLYATFTEVGAPVIEGVQDRYFIPLVPVVVVALAMVLQGGPMQAEGRSRLRGSHVAAAEGDTREVQGGAQAVMKANNRVALSLVALLALTELSFLVAIGTCLY